MRLLDRYIFRELLIPLGYCLVGILILWTSFSIFSSLDDYRDHNLSGGDIFMLQVVSLPESLLIIVPVSLLLALLLVLTNHARHNELVAMRAAGISLWRICVPYLVTGTVLSVGLFMLNDVLLPDSGERAEAIMDRHSGKKQQADGGWQKSINLRNELEGRQWEIGAYHPDLREMRQITLTWQLHDGGRRHLLAERAVWTNEVWQFEHVVRFTYRSAADPTPQREDLDQVSYHEITESPSLIKSEIKISKLTSFKALKKVQLSVGEIRRYLRLHPGLSGPTYPLLLTQLHGRLAAPWTCLVVVLVAIPFGAPSGRRNVFVGVASSLSIFFVYYVLMKLGLAFGTSGTMPPWLAAWLPNLFFAGLGIVLTFRVR